MGQKTHAVALARPGVGRATLKCGLEGKAISYGGRTAILQEHGMRVLYIADGAPTCKGCQRVLAGLAHPAVGRPMANRVTKPQRYWSRVRKQRRHEPSLTEQ